MLVYYLMIIIWAFAYLVFKPTYDYHDEYTIASNKKRNQLVAFCVVVLFLVMGLRGYYVGTDTLGYMNKYLTTNSGNIKISSNLITGEIGYKLLNWVFYKIGFSWQMFLMVTAIFESIVFGRFINKYCNNVFFGFFLHLTIGIFAMSMSGMRQSLAVAFVLFAVEAAINKKIFHYIIFIITAISMHYSAIVTIPIYFVFRIKFTRKRDLTIWLALPLSVRLFSSLIYSIITKLSLNKYILSGYFANNGISLSMSFELVSILILVACYVGLLIKNNSDITSKDYTFFILTCIYVSTIEMSHIVFMSARLLFYFIFFVITLMVNVVSTLPDIRIRTLSYFALFTLPLTQFLLSTPHSSYGIAHYVFFWAQ